MTTIPWLADALRAAGLEVVEHPSWKTRAVSGAWQPRFGVVHATAAPPSQSDLDQARIVRDGREGLPGPIANACVAHDGTWHVIAAGRCNTTLVGTGGPYKGLGNTYALGVEASNDNVHEPWPDAQYQAYARGWAAICRHLGWTPAHLVGHKEHTPGHKTDPTFNMDRFRQDVAAALAGEDDMSDVVKGIQEACKAAGQDPGPIDGVWGAKTQAALAAALKKVGPPGPAGPAGKTPTKVTISGIGTVTGAA